MTEKEIVELHRNAQNVYAEVLSSKRGFER